MNVVAKTDTELLTMLCGSAKAFTGKTLLEVFGMVPAKQKSLFMGEEMAAYHVVPQIAAAKELLSRCFLQEMKTGELLTQPKAVKDFLRLKIGALPYEVFWCLFLDNQNRLIEGVEMFRGTLTQTSVYPREVVKKALELNAASVVFAHNHPSGNVQPSRADEALTHTLKSALALVDVRVIDHVIVSTSGSFSFAENGIL